VSETYRDRAAAGQHLAAVVVKEAPALNPVVVALPRGGVPVALPVAEALHAPLDICVVRKIGAPGHSELACGAVTGDGSVVWNHSVLYSLGLTESELRRDRDKALKAAKDLEQEIRSSATPPLPLFAKTVFVVDDGLATGATMKAALKALLLQKPSRIVVAVPVASDDTCLDLESMGYSVVCPKRLPSGQLSSVGEWYDEFSQVESGECRRLLLLKRQPPMRETPACRVQPS